jgi:VWFA-related protein
MLRIVLLFFIAAALLAAQEPLVLIALDRQGQPITDLNPGELKLVDNGRAESISSLARLEQPSSSPLIILYDLLNTGIYARATVQQQIAQALQSLSPNMPAYLYLVNGGAELIPIRGIGAEAGPEWPRVAGTLLDGALRNTSIVRPNNLSTVGARVNSTYTMLVHLASDIARLPGRKNLVWVTHGVPLHGMSTSDTPVDYLPVLQKIAGGLAHEQIVIYPVQQTAGALPGANDTSPDTLKQFSAITGGRVFPNETVDKAVAAVLRETAASYVLTYEAKPDGKFHNLRVTCARRGVTIQARSGYFAQP